MKMKKYKGKKMIETKNEKKKVLYYAYLSLFPPTLFPTLEQTKAKTQFTAW